jgi:hypothetical protein
MQQAAAAASSELGGMHECEPGIGMHDIDNNADKVLKQRTAT